MCKDKLQEVYNIINHNWLRAQRGEICANGRKEYSLLACETVYNTIKDLKAAPTHAKMVEILKSVNAPITHANAKILMLTVKQVFNLDCEIGSINRSVKQKRMEVKGGCDTSFNKSINKLFSLKKLTKKEIKGLCYG